MDNKRSEKLLCQDVVGKLNNLFFANMFFAFISVTLLGFWPNTAIHVKARLFNLNAFSEES